MNKLGMITALMSLAVLPTYTIAHAQPPTSVTAPPRLVSGRVATFDQTGDMDKASGIIESTFSETQGRDATQ